MEAGLGAGGWGERSRVQETEGEEGKERERERGRETGRERGREREREREEERHARKNKCHNLDLPRPHPSSRSPTGKKWQKMDTPSADLASQEELPWKARLEEVNKRFPVKPRPRRRKPARPKSSPVYRGDMIGPRWRSQRTRAMRIRERFGGSNVYLLGPDRSISVGNMWAKNYERMQERPAASETWDDSAVVRCPFCLPAWRVLN